MSSSGGGLKGPFATCPAVVHCWVGNCGGEEEMGSESIMNQIAQGRIYCLCLV
jgi:hypothetical protein